MRSGSFREDSLLIATSPMRLMVMVEPSFGSSPQMYRCAFKSSSFLPVTSIDPSDEHYSFVGNSALTYLDMVIELAMMLRISISTPVSKRALGTAIVSIGNAVEVAPCSHVIQNFCVASKANRRIS